MKNQTIIKSIIISCLFICVILSSCNTLNSVIVDISNDQTKVIYSDYKISINLKVKDNYSIKEEKDKMIVSCKLLNGHDLKFIFNKEIDKNFDLLIKEYINTLYYGYQINYDNNTEEYEYKMISSDNVNTSYDVEDESENENKLSLHFIGNIDILPYKNLDNGLDNSFYPSDTDEGYYKKNINQSVTIEKMN